MSSSQSNRCQSCHKGLASEMSMDTKSNKLLVIAKPCHSCAIAKLVVRNFRDAELLYASICIYILQLVESTHSQPKLTDRPSSQRSPNASSCLAASHLKRWQASSSLRLGKFKHVKRHFEWYESDMRLNSQASSKMDPESSCFSAV